MCMTSYDNIYFIVYRKKYIFSGYVINGDALTWTQAKVNYSFLLFFTSILAKKRTVKLNARRSTEQIADIA